MDIYFYRSRYFEQSIGRFISEDGARFFGGDTNLIRYVSNQVLDRIDPSGWTASCPAKPDGCRGDSTTWEPYPDFGGGEETYHCGFECFRENSPDPWPQQECCYDANGLVGPGHPYEGCGGSPNDYPWWDPRHFGPWDRGGPWNRGDIGKETSKRYRRENPIQSNPPPNPIPGGPPSPVPVPAPAPTPK